MGAPKQAETLPIREHEYGEDLIGSGDEDDEVVLLTGASTAASWKEKRRAQRAIFDSWITSSAGQQALKPKTKKPADALDDNQSIHSLLASQQRGAQIVKNPREYQIELFERAKQQNTIAVLDTGSGKTLIAVLLLRWTIDNEIEHRAEGMPSKISFFLVASVTLVYQQFSVLEWDGARWQREFFENKVIVCTAEILNQALAHSYISMNQINLLIFDEAHHTKKNHSYARIIKDFYLTEEPASRPRVFGMTASPIDAKMDVVQAASELETLLDSKIATTSDMSLTAAIKKPVEEVMYYDALPQAGYETDLLRDVKARFGHIPVFSTVFERALQIARHLGRWPADSYLLHAFSHGKSPKYEMDVEKKFHSRRVHQEMSELDSAVQEIRDAIEYVQTRQNVLDRLSNTDVSSKVHKLHNYLSLQFERPSEHRCIVFVDRRYTARMLHNLFLRISTPHMHGHFLVGSNNGGLDEDSFSFKQQVLTLMKFRKGELNCLFATSVAEEGLDVPDCNLIIRFDMYATMIQYVQSRGRARNQNSKFIHMLERGNSIHSETLGDVRYAEASMRRYCELLPEDRKLEGNSDSLEVLLESEKTMESRIDPISGAKLTYANALSILAHFVTAVPTESDEPQHPTYVVSNRGQQYIAEAILPGNAPLRSKIGRIHTKRSLAKRSAAFDACVYLRTHGYLNKNLIPIYQKKLPAMRNALLAVNMKATSGYGMQIKPKIWAEQRGLSPKEMWVTIVDFPEGLDRSHQALAFLTRTPMPQLPCFPVYRNRGDTTMVKTVSLALPLIITEERLAKLSTFTFRVFKDVFSKTYEEEPLKLSYWMAPVRVSLDATETSLEAEQRMGPIAAIDWHLLDEVHVNDEYRWTPETPHDRYINKFIVDKFDGSRKFFSKGVDPSLKQTDPIPADAAKGKHSESILAYSVSLWKKSRAKILWAPNQPVIEAELAILRRNMLAPAEKKEIEGITKAYVCPEPLKVSALTPDIATSCIVWPSIIHRIESYLISIEGCTTIGLDCGPKFALAAFTKDSDNQGEHDAERVNFQRGMGENYERLEFIGDTFLKTATTISTFIQNPNENEFEFHVRRMQMLCNKNLFGTALKLKLYEYIRSMAFNRRCWYPEGLKLLVGTGVIKGQEKENYHEPRNHDLGEKTIADVCEALIGAAYLTWDKPEAWKPELWTNAVKAVTTLVDSDDHRMLQWDDYKAAYNKPHYQTAEVTAVQRDLAQKVELEHAYHFNYPRLLYSSFMHPSVPYIYEKVPNYQRLEFLGDALLDQASITYLFHKYPDKDPQWLTEHKMAMVSNKFLGALCVNIGFHKHLRHYNAILQSQITAYAADLLEAKRVAGDSRDYWTTVSDPPKCLPDIVEAYIGAIFIDSDFNYSEVQRFFDEHVQWYFEDMTVYDTFANNHPCTHLHNTLQTTFGCMDYRLMAKELPSIDGLERKDVVAVVTIHDKIIASSAGKSGRYARLRVAQKARAELDGLAPFEFRAKFGCDCKVDEDGQVKLGQDLGPEGEDAGGLGGIPNV
ncbi:putative ribonuclease III domain, helicase, dicer dimerization domain-containing protein [Septoria linicola]|nr:putative ribonuclease III domain, helicase, dicer dimerization domain-containing protein [Septoria linicola]